MLCKGGEKDRMVSLKDGGAEGIKGFKLTNSLGFEGDGFCRLVVSVAGSIAGCPEGVPF